MGTGEDLCVQPVLYADFMISSSGEKGCSQVSTFFQKNNFIQHFILSFTSVIEKKLIWVSLLLLYFIK